MKIIKRNADNVVLFAAAELSMNGNLISSNGWTYNNAAGIALTLETVDSLPDGFVAGGWTYSDSMWAITTGALNTLLPLKKQLKISELNSTFNAMLEANIDHNSKNWLADAANRAAIAQFIAPGGLPAGFYWLDSSGVQVTMNYAELQALMLAINTRRLSFHQNLMTKTTAVNSATTLAGVDAVIW